MMIFRYWLTNGRTFDEVSPVQDQPIDVVRDHLAASLCPPVLKPRDAWLIPAFWVTDTKGVAHVVNTANLVEAEVLEVEDFEVDPVKDLPSFYQVEVPSGEGERGGFFTQEELDQASKDMRAHLRLVK